MPRIDHAGVVADLKAFIVDAGKPGFGARELLEQIARLEAKHAVPADRYEQFLGRFAREFEDAFRGVLPPRGGASSDEAAAPIPPTGLPAEAKGELARPSGDSPSPEGGPIGHERTTRAGHPPARARA
jgi:hypothetical protein